nr:DUF2170 family protein [Photorhabdus luminescens]
MCGRQITVEALLFSEESVLDPASLNQFILETHSL